MIRVVALGMAAALLAAMPARPDPAAAFALGDEVAYRITAGDYGVEVRLMLEQRAGCADGFGRALACIAGRFGWTNSDGRSFAVPFEWASAHAEAVAWGNWEPGVPEPQQHFYAAASPFWMGYPHRFGPHGRTRFTDAIRTMLVGAMAVPMRWRASGDGTFGFAGATGDLVASTGGVTATFDASYSFAPARFEVGLDEQAWPRAVTFTSDAGVMVAERIAFHPGDDPIDAGGWTPLPLDGARAELLAWDDVPPVRDPLSMMVTPLEARLLAVATPGGARWEIEHPGDYLLSAFYSERRTHAAGGPGPADARDAGWSLTAADGTDAHEWLTVHAGANLAPAAHAGVAIDDLTQPEQLDPPAQSRARLPARVVGFDDAIAIGRAHMPFHADAFHADWDVSRDEALLETPDAIVYRIGCGPAGPTQWALTFTWVSAVNGQVLARVNLTGDASCDGDLGLGLPGVLDRAELPFPG